ncbi:VanZ family protein [Streptomyces sp. NPDC056670]|uniref:VanZ family protein n=1 Tax=unclassified Streptomyces TaxID=2593676 RepID=UPI0036B21758
MASEPRLQRRTWAAVAARAVVLVVGFVCMVGFAVVLAKATLVPSPASVRLTHTNLHPGDSIRAYLAQPDWRDAVKQVGGNVVLGMPFGVLLPVLFPRTRGVVRVVLMTAFVMLTVEGAQGLLVTGRAFDIDDVILNSTGAFAGYLLLGRRLGRALHPRRRHWWQHRPAEPVDPQGRPVEEGDAPPPEASDSPYASKSRLPAILRAVRKPVR